MLKTIHTHRRRVIAVLENSFSRKTLKTCNIRFNSRNNFMTKQLNLLSVFILFILMACGFEADNKILTNKNTIDINVKLGTTTVYNGYGFYIGVVNKDTTKDYTFTIENIGTKGNLLLTGNPAVSISGDGFTITSQPGSTTLAPGDRTNFIVHFAPTEAKAYEGIVTILNNDTGETDYTFALLSENYSLPGAPTVTGTATTTNTKPTWTWTSGGNWSGIFRCKLDSNDLSTGTTETKDTSFTPAAPIPPGNHILYVQEKDASGKYWSVSGSFTTNIRLNPPVVTGTTPTANTKPTWSWTAGGGGNEVFRCKLDNNDLSTGATVTTDKSFTPDAPIAPGYHYLYVQEQDINSTFWSGYGSYTIQIRFKAPIVTGTSPTTNTKPTWTWTSGGDGNGVYRYKLDSNDFSSGATQTTTTSFTPAAPIAPGYHYFYVQEQDINSTFWSDYGSYTIQIRFRAPIVTGTSPTANTKPTWTWTSGGDGNGVYRCKLDSNDFSTGATQTNTTSFTPSAPIPPGDHYLYVQEQDSNSTYWSDSGSFRITIRFSAPTVTGTSPTANTKPTWTWTSGGDGNGVYRYNLDSNDFSTGATVTSITTYTPVTPIQPGYHTLYVQEQEPSANFWSGYGYCQIFIRFRAPVVTGTTSPTSNTRPTWTWTTGGDGNGVYRYKLDSSDLTTGTIEISGTSFTPSAPISLGWHRLYVQEHDASGIYWSLSGSYDTTIQLNPPIVSGIDATSETQPTWTWITGGGNGYFRYKLDSSDLSSGSTETTGTSCSPGSPLSDGNHTLYVQEKDVNGAYWSPSGTFTAAIRIMSAIGWIGGGSDGWKTANGASSGSNYQSLCSPESVYIDSSGNIYVAEYDSNRISKWDANGKAIGWIGGGINSWQTSSGASSGNGYQNFYHPSGVFVDSAGYIYVADSGNHRVSKWKSNGEAQGWIGGGSNGWKITTSSSSGSAYQYFNCPNGVSLDSSGNIYVVEYNNHRISKWNASGEAQGWIGGGSNGWKITAGSSSGSAYQYFNYPNGVSLDSSGNIYVAENNNYRISKWNASGEAQGWIGGGSNGWKKANGASSGNVYQCFEQPQGVFVDTRGDIYVTDLYNDRISKWDSSGVAQGCIGVGSNGWQKSGATGFGSEYRYFTYPEGIFVDISGDIYIADTYNNRISKWHQY
jgi:hypothetical protein